MRVSVTEMGGFGMGNSGIYARKEEIQQERLHRVWIVKIYGKILSGRLNLDGDGV